MSKSISIKDLKEIRTHMLNGVTVRLNNDDLPEMILGNKWVLMKDVFAVAIWDKECIGKEIVQIDGDKWNFSLDNLKLV